ncbi:MAG: NAD(P)H-dependent oxidoreductase subunit E [Arthrospira sp. SH-MAG29]|nr:(2Fe-2S) ferredoxin domain-containing protein [Arthrospira sp. SH-MAG29]MBS0016086.1 NAD(P)H-dependent oxidoreductase subunit E [Arthrospira sp. SH-MAG29]
MSKFNKQVSDFTLSGRVVQVLFKGNKPQIMQLMTTSGLLTIKLSKRLRDEEKHLLSQGVEVRVFGEKILNLKNAKVKLKATKIISASEPSVRPVNSSSAPTKSKAKPAKILICQKSDCRDRGGQTVCRVLEQALCDRGLHDQVKIEKTGCLKKCKLGPNLVVMPDKAHYTKVKPSDISQVIEKHLASTTT